MCTRYTYSCVTRYHDLKKGERLNDIQEKQRLSESQLQSLEARKNEISAELNKCKDLMRNQDQLRRNIEDNLNYRTTKAEVEELTHEIESLEEQILKIGGIPAVEAELVKISRERERLLSEVSRLLYIYSSQSDITHKLNRILVSMVSYSFVVLDAKCKILQFSFVSI